MVFHLVLVLIKRELYAGLLVLSASQFSSRKAAKVKANVYIYVNIPLSLLEQFLIYTVKLRAEVRLQHT